MDLSSYPDLFYYARHGETLGNKDGIAVGSAESPLTDRGKKIADERAGLVAGMDIHTICVSPLQRAQETAQRMNALKKCPLVTIQNFHEWDVGQLTGLPENENLAFLTSYTGDPLGGETRLQLENRIHLAMLEYSQMMQGKTGLIVAHGGVGRALMKNLKLNPATHFPNCAVFKFQRKDGVWQETLLSRS